MKILNIDQIRGADAFTIQHEPIVSLALMERAALACFNWITEKHGTHFIFKIICGLGNNGGDGLAIARLLAERKYSVEVFIINYSEKRSSDFITNLEKLKSVSQKYISIEEFNTFESFQISFISKKESILIDALFGFGINKPIEGFPAQVVECINNFGSKIISIDVPSGLYCDDLNNPNDFIVKADYTLSFQFPKLSFMFPETYKYVGEFCILNIGLHPEYINGVQVQNYFTTKEDIVPFLKKRSKISHKDIFGHSLIIAGSYGKIGAAVLAAKACLRTGTGLLTVHLPKCGYEIIQTVVPEAMVDVDSELNFISDTIVIEKYNAIGVGPGINTEKQTQNILKFLIQNAIIPIVFDADAINIISENKTWLSFIPRNSIFTPHIKEFERLAGKSATSMERLKLQRDFSVKYSVYVVLKGSHTAISCPNGTVFFNSTGNSGMAKGGSGDVLTGIITSLVAQGYTSQLACIIGVFIHGLAGDFAVKNISEESILASDIIESISDAFDFLKA